MANPQVEEGYTRIANELFERIISAPSLGSAEFACLLFVIRQTWGWGKKEAEIAQKQFAENTGRPVESVRTALASLRKKRIIAQVEPPAFDRAAIWSVNKNWEEWDFEGGGDQKPHSPSKTTLPLKNHTTLPLENHTPLPHKNNTPVRNAASQVQKNQQSAPARKLQKEILKKKKEIKDKAVDDKTVDARFVPLRDFFFQAFEKNRGYKYRPTGADFSGLKALVRDTKGKPEYDLPNLQAAMSRFFASEDPFHLKQGKPLAFFASNIHAFMNGSASSQKKNNAWAHVGEHVPSAVDARPEEIEEKFDPQKEREERIKLRNRKYKEFRATPANKRSPSEKKFIADYESGKFGPDGGDE